MKSNQTILIERSIRKIENRYNGDNNLNLYGPDVTWAEYELVQMINRLIIVVEDLQDQINNLRVEQ